MIRIPIAIVWRIFNKAFVRKYNLYIDGTCKEK